MNEFGLSLPKLPYRKTSNVASMDARRPKAPPAQKRQAPVVPWRQCEMYKSCILRMERKCNSAFCQKAAEFDE